jgi:hypothetical protein
MNTHSILRIFLACSLVGACAGTVVSHSAEPQHDAGAVPVADAGSDAADGSGGFPPVGKLPGCTVGNNGARCQS